MLRIVAGTYHVEIAGARRILECSLRGRVKHAAAVQVAVGDRVRVERLADGSCRIRELLPRSGVLSRLGVARRREQVIAANVDQVAAVVAVAQPEPDLSMLDRLLVVGELNRLAALLIVNKRDLRPPDTPSPPSVFRAYGEAGYDVLLTSAKSGEGLSALRRRLRRRTTVLTGPSGVGKSSLLNALMPGLGLRIGQVGDRSGKGRHTTVAAALYPFGEGGYVVDTPGLQYLSLWKADPAALSAAFPEFRPLARDCRFADCRHRSEPGCAVLASVTAGTVTDSRYRSYVALLEEAEARG
ncbi:MAG: ribosome small subunit-dependent GTPase A [Gemmatimonadota bacterium]